MMDFDFTARDLLTLIIIGLILYYYSTKTNYLESELTKFMDLIGEQQVKIDQIREQQENELSGDGIGIETDDLFDSEQIHSPHSPHLHPPESPHLNHPHVAPPPLNLRNINLDGARERLMDPLVPPVRRGETSPMQSFLPFNIPTRGEYGPFEQVGYITSTEDKSKVSILMGRRIHSRQHEYYTFHPQNDKIKIPIDIAGKRELRQDEKIRVDGLGEAQVHIYEQGTPRYIPY